jgi:hypothetical protein
MVERNFKMVERKNKHPTGSLGSCTIEEPEMEAL